MVIIMVQIVTQQKLLHRVRQAIASQEGFIAFRDSVLDYYSADDDYIFKTDELKLIFSVLAVYLEFEEVYGDSLRLKRLARLGKALSAGQIRAEHVVIALEYERIAALACKLYAGLISKPVFDRQLRQICPIKKIDWETVVRLYEDSLCRMREKGSSLKLSFTAAEKNR